MLIVLPLAAKFLEFQPPAHCYITEVIDLTQNVTETEPITVNGAWG